MEHKHSHTLFSRPKMRTRPEGLTHNTISLTPFQFPFQFCMLSKEMDWKWCASNLLASAVFLDSIIFCGHSPELFTKPWDRLQSFDIRLFGKFIYISLSALLFAYVSVLCTLLCIRCSRRRQRHQLMAVRQNWLMVNVYRKLDA